jgi:hypothetical protein
MAFIDIHPSLNKSEEFSELIMTMINDTSSFERDMTIYEVISQKIRPGLNSDVIANSIISRFENIGIPSGPLVNGHPNVMEAFVYVVCEEIVEAIQNDMIVKVGVLPGGTINANGANAGGPVVSIGSVINAQEGVGVAK